MVLDGLASLIGAEMPDAEIMVWADPHLFLETLSAQRDYTLVISDLFLNKMNGLALSSAIRGRMSNLPVLLISGHEETLPTETIIASGAMGFVSKKDGNQTLIAAIHAALAGKFFLQGEALERNALDMSECMVRPDGDEFRYPALTARQLEILKLIAGGAANREIASTLAISENTVKSHIKVLFSELNVNKRAACVRQARVYGLI